MVYHLVRPVARYVLKYYFRNIDLTGLDNIPADAPVILAANHPTAFIEPCILACFQPRTLRFLARGNLFKNTFYRTLLAAVNILPVFRLEDGGYGRLKDNFSTFDACFQALSRRQAIMILAEGRCIHEKALRPLRKGTARIALGALDRDATLKEVYIVPVGCNFTHPERVRSDVMVRCGEPILASTFLQEYRTNEAVAIKKLTSHLRARLSPLIVQFPSPEVAGIGEAILELDRAQHPVKQGITHTGKQLDRELELANTIPEEAPATSLLFNRLAQNRIPVAALLGQYREDRKKSLGAWFRALLALLLLLPHFPLWALSEYIGASRPKHIEFYSPVRFAVVAGGTFLLYPILLLTLAWPLKIWLVIAILCVHWSLAQVEDIYRWYQNRKVERMVDRERQHLRQLVAQANKPTESLTI